MAVVERSDQGNARILTFNRPEARNAVNMALLEELDAELERALKEQVRCLVLEGTGIDYGAGGDTKEGVDKPPSYLERLLDLSVKTVRTIYTFPAPTISIIQGNVMGASIEFALACDLRFVARNAKIRVGFDRFAAPPEVISATVLPQLMGISRAKHFFYSGEVWSGDDAVRDGLSNQVFPEEKLRAEALAFAEAVAAGPTGAYARGKAMMDMSFERTLEENLAAAHKEGIAAQQTEDAAEGVAALAEGRIPVFKNR